VGELAALLQKVERHARLADVVHQCGESKLVQLKLGHSESPAERDGKDADVDRVRECVFVVVADRRQSDERCLFVQYLVDDSLHHALDLPDVRRLADPDGIDHVLRHRYRLRVSTIGSSLRFLVELLVAGGLGGCVELERLDLRVAKTSKYLLQSLGGGSLRLSAEQREQQAPVARCSIIADMDRADPGELAKSEYVPEGGVIAQIESQPRLVEEDELTRDSEFQLALFGAQFLGDLGEIVDGFLHGAVLERIELDRPQSGVEGDHEVSSAAADAGARLLLAVGPHWPRRGGRHALPPRIALLTAFLTMTSFSPVARWSASVAFAELILPSAMAAQARISPSSFLPMKPFELSRPSRKGTPASPLKTPYASKNAIFS